MSKVSALKKRLSLHLIQVRVQVDIGNRLAEPERDEATYQPVDHGQRGLSSWVGKNRWYTSFYIVGEEILNHFVLCSYSVQ